MIGLFFEVQPIEGHASNYFDMAASLRPELEKNGGLLFIDRYQRVDQPEVVLSHSLWETEYDLIRWREHSRHRVVQRAGRDLHFKEYRIRIGRLIEADEAEASARDRPSAALSPDERQLWTLYFDERPAVNLGGTLFSSVYRENKFLMLNEGHRGNIVERPNVETRGFVVFRDYGMFDRREAPRHYPAVSPGRAMQDAKRERV